MAGLLPLCLLFLRLASSSGVEGNQQGVQNSYKTLALARLDVSSVIDQHHVRVSKVGGYKGAVVYKFFAKDGYKFQPITYKDKPLQPYNFAYADYAEFVVAEDIRIVMLRCNGGSNAPKIYVYDVTYTVVEEMTDPSAYFKALASHVNNIKIVVEAKHPTDEENITDDYFEEFIVVDKNKLVSLLQYGTLLVWTFDANTGEQLQDCKVYHPKDLADFVYITLRLEDVKGKIVYRNFKVNSQGEVSVIFSNAATVIASEGKTIHESSTVQYYQDETKLGLQTVEFNVASVDVEDAIQRALELKPNEEIRIVIEPLAGYVFKQVSIDKDIRVNGTTDAVFLHVSNNWQLLHFGTSSASPSNLVQRFYFVKKRETWQKISLAQFKIHRMPYMRRVFLSLLEYNEGIEYKRENVDTSEVGMYAYDDYFIEHVGLDGGAFWSCGESKEVFSSIRIKMNKPSALVTVYVLSEDNTLASNKNSLTIKEFDDLKHTIFGKASVEECGLVETYKSPAPMKHYNQSMVIELDLKRPKGNIAAGSECFDESGGSRHCIFTAMDGYKLRPLTFGDYTLWGEINCFAYRVELISTDRLAVARVYYRDENGVGDCAYYKLCSRGSHKMDPSEYFKIVMVDMAIVARHLWPEYPRDDDSRVNQDYYVEFYAIQKQMIEEIRYKEKQVWAFDVYEGEQVQDYKVYHPKDLADFVYITLRLEDVKGKIVYRNFKVNSQGEVSVIFSDAATVIASEGKTISDTNGVQYYQDEIGQEPKIVEFSVANVDIEDVVHRILASQADEEVHILIEPPAGHVFKGLDIGQYLLVSDSPKCLFLHVSKRWQLLHFGTSSASPSNLVQRFYFVKRGSVWQRISLAQFKIHCMPYMKKTIVKLLEYNEGIEYTRNKSDGVETIEIRERFGYFFEIVYLINPLHWLFHREDGTVFDHVKIETKIDGTVATLVYFNGGQVVEERTHLSRYDVYMINKSVITQGNDAFCSVESALLQKSVLVHLDISKSQGNQGTLVEIQECRNDAAIYRFVPKDGYRFLPVTYRDIPLQPHEQVFTTFAEVLALDDNSAYVRVVGKNYVHHMVSSIYYIHDTKAKKIADKTEYFKVLEAIADKHTLVFGARYPIDDENITDDYFEEYAVVDKNKLLNRVQYLAASVWEFDASNGAQVHDYKVYHPKDLSDFVYITLRLKDAQEEIVYRDFKVNSQGEVSVIFSDAATVIASEGKTIHESSTVQYYQDEIAPEVTGVGFNMASVDVKDAIQRALESPTSVEVRMVIEPPPGYYFGAVYIALFACVEDKVNFAFFHASSQWQLWDFVNSKTPNGERIYYKKQERDWRKISSTDFKVLRFPFLIPLQLDLLKHNLGMEVIEEAEKAQTTSLKEYFGYAVTQVNKGNKTLWVSNKEDKLVFDGIEFVRNSEDVKVTIYANKNGMGEYARYNVTLDEYAALLGEMHPPAPPKMSQWEDKEKELRERQETYKIVEMEEGLLVKRMAMDLPGGNADDKRRKNVHGPANQGNGNSLKHLNGFTLEPFVGLILTIAAVVVVC